MPTSFADCWRTKKSKTLRAEDEEAVYLAVDARIDRPRLVGESGFSSGAQVGKSAGEDNSEAKLVEVATRYGWMYQILADS